MVTALEIALLLVVLAFFVGAAKVARTVEAFVVNAVVGLLVLLVADALGVSVAVTPIILLIVALGGFAGAVLSRKCSVTTRPSGVGSKPSMNSYSRGFPTACFVGTSPSMRSSSRFAARPPTVTFASVSSTPDGRVEPA